MADIKTIGFAIVAIILVVIAAVGFYEYSVANSKYLSLESNYQSVQSQYMTLQGNYTKLNQTYGQLASKYSELEGLYQTMLMYAKNNYTLYKQAESNYTYYKMLYQQMLQEVSKLNVTGYRPGAALATVLQFYDGIAIESPSDVLPYLAPNFTAMIIGQPFAGTYNLNTFNSTWLSDFFGTYETVYFYTTALPTVTPINGNVYNITDVVQYFVAPTSDPVYLQVFNASNTIIVQFINGMPEITELMWKGNEVSPSAVIAGYPSQHSLQANQVLEEFLSQINALGAEFPANTISQSFAPNAQLILTGQLPPVFKVGTYNGTSNIQKVFRTWDNYFIFALTYVQNLLPNGTAVPPTVEVMLTPSGANAEVIANDTVFFGFVNQGEPNFPMIYDLHVDINAYFSYNTTTASWQITKEVWNVTQVNALSDTIYYNLNQPIMKVSGEQTVMVNATSGQGYALQVGNMMVIVKPHTYAELANGTLLPVYNFSLVTFSLEAIYPPAAQYNLTPLFAFAFAVNGQITPAISLVTNVNGKIVAQAPITMVWAPDTWTSWTWFGGTFNGTAYIGGSYKFADHWLYGNGVMINVQFFKPVIWIFESSETPVATPPKPVQVSVSPAYGLTPVNVYSYEINGTQGGVAFAGNMIVVVQPNTKIVTPSGNLTVFNFSVVFYNPANAGNAPNGQAPILAFAYAINGNVTFSYSSVNSVTGQANPFITIILTPSQDVTMWTWGPKGYLFEDPIIVGNGVVINLTFFKPVPWILTAPVTSSTSTSTSMSSSSTTSTTSTYTWGG
ncbi:hypothetical protein BFU36_04155 [Sulfolobus sp. A20]|uniref:hypothetical protein n=1 Tax=Sulfolobaceae TaxID=118883 RepID=UPI00084627EB|nr:MULTISPECIES: hypothetical protein [unclassified Sulfolobus]TRM73801.1 hypothetical protein DJ523_06420 [Sulfolobus sp. E5]TRM75350.1 hypothetical protein DJ532_10425 [Sulfolobus sp. A20-N-F8]TRM76365.1 hypothetical protein DJ528_08305 [Sulfolobus sp. B5]TRM81311.1 hypothetical protein DJ524_04530 [Sulfolobus sp. D5]TRM84705.1 hypothetical protein DJ522_03715 [Sulfolobus sp. F3]TRM88698.1 hypothetical protein DJ521_01375 [Sulfolobus sp. E3]TRM93051.1 hypothetical protein DJ526_04765 [Sulf